MIVYGATLSPFVRKTMAFAAEKGLNVELRPMMPSKDNAELTACSPFGKIPGFRDGDFTISDSSAIVAYMDAMKPDPVLIPADPQSRARTIWYDEFADTILFPCFAKMFFNRVVSPKFLGKPGDLDAADKAEREEMPPLLDYIEGVLPQSGFLVGDRLTLADISVASPLASLEHCGVAIDAGRFPKVKRFADAMHARPSFAPMLAQERAYLAA